MTEENVVAKDQCTIAPTDELFTNEDGLRQSIGAGLNGIRQVEPPRSAGAQQVLETRCILRCRDDQHVANLREHQGGERIVNHGLVVDRQKLLGDRTSPRPEPRAGATGENDALAVQAVSPLIMSVMKLRMSSCQGGKPTPKACCSFLSQAVNSAAAPPASCSPPSELV